MTGNYVAAVIGGACAGSEIAAQLSDLGMDVVVFEQNPLPYGKIEDGLPRWHVKLQNKEKSAIDEKMSRANVHFVPQCKLGENFTLEELRRDWGLSLVIMANGAWRDRPLSVDGVDRVSDDSFVYQNDFVYWYNHYPEKNFKSKAYRALPGTVVIGGGLASIDVVKICMFELVARELKARGHDVDIVEFEHHGIFKALEKRGLTWEELRLEPARLYYRKRVRDMPLVPLGDDPDPTKLEKAKLVREKLVNNGCTRYGFEVHPLRSPSKVHVENGSVRAVTFRKMAYEDGRFRDTGETETVETGLLISSIGSIPEPIPGVPMDGELYLWEDRFTGEVKNLSGVYCVGNAITGRGNIKDSLQNARRLGTLVGNGLQGTEPDYEAWFKSQREQARAHVERMLTFLRGMPPLTQEARAAILARVRRLQEERGASDYGSWRDRVLAER